MAMVVVCLAMPTVLGLEHFPSSLAGNQSDPNFQCYHLNLKPLDCQDCSGALLLALQPLGFGVLSLLLLLSSYQSIFRPGVCAKGPGCCGHTGPAQWLLSSCPLWLCGVWQQGPPAARGNGMNRSTGRLQEARGSWRDLPVSPRAEATAPALHSLRETLGDPAEWLKNCASVLGFVFLFVLEFLFIWGFLLCCGGFF